MSQLKTVKESNRWLWLICKTRQHAVREKCKICYCSELTTWSTVLLKKLAAIQLVKKLPAFCGTRSFITAFTTARHLSLLWARKSNPCPHRTSWRSILILSSNLLSPIRAICPTHLILLDLIARNNIWWGMQTPKLLVMQFSALLYEAYLVPVSP
jgi:hypothetical protein